jgi:F-type H+-transporting ATPase subunit gamma
MPSLKEVRNRINSVKSTQQITKAMKMVAAAKLRRAQDAITQMRPYSHLLNKIIQNLSASSTDNNVQSVFTQEREPNKILIIVITSDRGLCGAFNSNIIKTSVNLAQEKYSTQLAAGAVNFLCIGTKGYDSIRKRGFKVFGEYAHIFHNLNFAKVKEAGEFVLNGFANQTFDRVEIVYNEFKNVATQVVQTQQFLPITSSNQEINEPKGTNTDYILEPSQEEIIQELIPKSLKIRLYSSVLESNASEHGARMTAMDKATENAEELIKELTLMYNRSRQAAITKEILEIVGGAEALKGA